jgi:hypothetical protein
MTDRFLVGSQQPPFKEGDHTVDPWHQQGVFFFPFRSVTSYW